MIGCDLGGTKTEMVAISRDGEFIQRLRSPTPCDYPQVLNQLESMYRQLCSSLGFNPAFGIGIPGTISADGIRVKNANSQWLNGRSLLQDLSHRLECSISLANDANCFTLSEAVDGAGAEYQSVFGVILGTGCGGGWSLAKRVIGGRNGLTGEWGHCAMPNWQQLTPNIEACYCGKRGCIEQFVSGPGFLRRIEQSNGVRFDEIQDLVAAAKDGDELASTWFARYPLWVAQALSVVINTIDPDCIVLGGGLSQVDEWYGPINRALAEHVFGGECSTPVLANQHGDASGVRGAAWLTSSDAAPWQSIRHSID
ncbi:ROK family protein [Paraferrimonas sedimenticola]|nr:ROK family protein [Paraferrimonas sedimenticola]